MFFITHQTSNGKKWWLSLLLRVWYNFHPDMKNQYYFTFSNTCLLCSQILSIMGDKMHFRPFFSNEDELSFNLYIIKININGTNQSPFSLNWIEPALSILIKYVLSEVWYWQQDFIHTSCSALSKIMPNWTLGTLETFSSIHYHKLTFLLNLVIMKIPIKYIANI